MKKYLVIAQGEDGPYVAYLTQDELQERLKEEWNGWKFLSSPPTDLQYGIKQLFIMEGNVVVPKPEQVVTSWKF